MNVLVIGVLLYALVNVGVSYEYEVSQAGFGSSGSESAATDPAGAIRADWIRSELEWIWSSLGFVAVNVLWTSAALVAGRRASKGVAEGAG